VTYHEQRTLEARFTGQMDWIDWVLGGFYYKADENEVRVIISPFNNLQRYRNDFFQPQNKSVYANATLHPFGEGFSLVLGGRYSDDKKPLEFNNQQDGNPAGDIIFDQLLETSRFDWKVGVNYEASPDVLLYASAATGFRLPTFNSRPFQPSQVFQIPGDDLISYEIGTKADLFDRRLRINTVAFYTDYKQRSSTVSGSEYQIGPDGQLIGGSQVTEPLPGGPAGSTRCRNLTPAEISSGVDGFACVPRSYPLNTPGEVYGFELELQAEPVDNLRFDASVGYARFKSEDLQLPGRITDKLTGIPEWNASAGVQYEYELASGDGSITPRLDWLYTGPTDFSTSRPELNGLEYSVFNGRITYQNYPNGFSVALGVTNLFDKFYYLNFFDLSGFGFPQTNAQPARPREWSVTVSKRF
jgi:iron complex outermembrane receptor protein